MRARMQDHRLPRLPTAERGSGHVGPWPVRHGLLDEARSDSTIAAAAEADGALPHPRERVRAGTVS